VIRQIYLDFPKVQGDVINGKLYQLIIPLQSPFVFNRSDEKNRVTFMVNFEVVREP
jgi:hypothetical protein